MACSRHVRVRRCRRQSCALPEHTARRCGPRAGVHVDVPVVRRLCAAPDTADCRLRGAGGWDARGRGNGASRLACHWRRGGAVAGQRLPEPRKTDARAVAATLCIIGWIGNSTTRIRAPDDYVELHGSGLTAPCWKFHRCGSGPRRRAPLSSSLLASVSRLGGSLSASRGSVGDHRGVPPRASSATPGAGRIAKTLRGIDAAATLTLRGVSAQGMMIAGVGSFTGIERRACSSLKRASDLLQVRLRSN